MAWCLCEHCNLTIISPIQRRCPDCEGKVIPVDRFGRPKPQIGHYCGCGTKMERVPHLRCPRCGYEPYKRPPDSLRDTYRSKVYAWQCRFKGWPGKKLTLPECKVLVWKVWDENEHSQIHRPPPMIRDGRGCRIARGGAKRITLPRWARSTYIVLHEVTHALLALRMLPVPWHGSEFCQKYVELLDRYAGLVVGMPEFFQPKLAAATPKLTKTKEKPMRAKAIKTNRWCPICNRLLRAAEPLPTEIVTCKQGHFWRYWFANGTENFTRVGPPKQPS